LFLSLAAALAPGAASAHHGWGGYDTSKSFTATSNTLAHITHRMVTPAVKLRLKPTSETGESVRSEASLGGPCSVKQYHSTRNWTEIFRARQRSAR